MQAAAAATPRRRLRSRARLLVQGIDAASAAAQTETGADAGRFAPRMQADRQSAVRSEARSNVRFSPKSGHELSVLGCPLSAQKATYAVQQDFAPIVVHQPSLNYCRRDYEAEA